MAMPQMSPNNAGFAASSTTTRTSYIPTTPQLRRYADYTNPSVSPQMPRRSSPSKSNYGRMSPTKQQHQNYGHSSFKSAPLSDIDSVQLPQILYLQKSPLETHKCRMQNKLKFALLSLTVICFVSSVTAYFGYLYAFSDEYEFNRKVFETNEKPEFIFGYQVHLFHIIKQSIFVASWSTFFSSLGTLFVVGIQLFFALKIVKNQPDSAQLALNFLAEGKYVRTVAVFLWFLSFICFIFLIQSTIHIVALELIPKIVATSVGIIVAIICLYAAVQSLYQICRIDYVVPTHFSMDERYDLDAVGGHYARGGNNNNFSTLV
uniref:Uncharacterized protein n=1 Tax=Panagrolaimus superbus TaxID=310955 RepID=A0A914YXC5_9BILA